MNEVVYPPVETRELSLPPLDELPRPCPGGPELPRILREAASIRIAERRLGVLTALFILLSLLELLLFLSLRASELLIVYRDPGRTPLVGGK